MSVCDGCAHECCWHILRVIFYFSRWLFCVRSLSRSVLLFATSAKGKKRNELMQQLGTTKCIYHSLPISTPNVCTYIQRFIRISFSGIIKGGSYSSSSMNLLYEFVLVFSPLCSCVAISSLRLDVFVCLLLVGVEEHCVTLLNPWIYKRAYESAALGKKATTKMDDCISGSRNKGIKTYRSVACCTG